MMLTLHPATYVYMLFQSAMPTFVFIKNRQTLETIKGANPAAIEGALRKHAGAPQRDFTEGPAAPQDKALQGHVSFSASMLS